MSSRPSERLQVKIMGAPTKAEGNPYNTLLYNALRKKGVEIEEFAVKRSLQSPPTVIHFHWPESMFHAETTLGRLRLHLRLFTCLAIARLRGVKVCWTIHNLEPHDGEPSWAKALFRLWFPRLLTHYTCLSQGSEQKALETFPALRRKKGQVIPHGDYRPVYPSIPARSTCRAHLEYPDTVFVIGHLGMIRTYKNVPGLMRAFSATAGEDLRLFVAGEAKTPELKQEVATSAGQDSRIQLKLEFVPETQIPLLMAGLDLFILPHAKVLNSGAALLALSFNIPIVAPKQGSLIDLAADLGRDWVWLYEGSLCSSILSDAIAHFRAFPKNRICDLSAYNWEKIGSDTAAHLRT